MSKAVMASNNNPSRQRSSEEPYAVLDFTQASKGEEERRALAKAVVQEVADLGYFYLTGHGIADQIVSKNYDGTFAS